MRKIISILILAAMLCPLLLSLPVGAATSAVGMTFSSGFDSLFKTSKQISALPHTLEATITVPASQSDTYEGDILAWYEPSVSASPYIVWDLMWKNGQLSPRLLCASSASGSKKEASIVFRGAFDSYRGQTIHVALTFDSANDNVELYINGNIVSCPPVYEYSATSEATFLDVYESINASSLANHSLGGDGRPGKPNSQWAVERVDNYRYFRGAIFNAVAFSDIRSANEIRADKSAMPTGDPALLFSYDTSKLDGGAFIPDSSGNGYDLRGSSVWFSQHSQINNYAYSFAVIGDTQVVSRDEAVSSAATHSPNFKGNYAKIFDYLVNNKDTKNIEFAFHMGDITDWSNPAEWQLVMENINKLNGKIPYNLVRGNHDTGNDFIENYTMDTFVSNVVDGEEYGTFDNNTLNTYQTLTVGKVKYLMLSLDLGPCKAVVEWANRVVEAHPHHNVIISTHSYLHSSGAYMDDPKDCSATQYNPGGKYNGGSEGVYWDYRLQKYKNGGEDYLYQDASYMWENLVRKHENICMVLCGHECSDDILKVDTVGENGNKIVQLLIDAQCVDRRLQQAGMGHAGMIAMLYFSEDGKTVSTEYYSTIREQYFKSENIYTFELDLVDPVEDDDDQQQGGGTDTDDDQQQGGGTDTDDDQQQGGGTDTDNDQQQGGGTDTDNDQQQGGGTDTDNDQQQGGGKDENDDDEKNDPLTEDEKPTEKPTSKPTSKPTDEPTSESTEKPTAAPSEALPVDTDKNGCGSVVSTSTLLLCAIFSLCMRKKDE